MIVEDLEALLPALAVEALGLNGVDQVYLSDRPRTDGTLVELEIKPAGTEATTGGGWGVSSRLHRYVWILSGQELTRGEMRRMLERATARLHNRRAPVVAGLELTTVGEISYEEQDGVGDTLAPLSAQIPVTHKADVRHGEV